MKIPALLCASVGGPAAAEMITCDMAGTAVAFEIDHTQFSLPQSPDDPPRRKVTSVTMGDAIFDAEPVVLGEARGFWAEGQTGANVILMMQDDGSAIYTDQQTGIRLTGTCEVQQ